MAKASWTHSSQGARRSAPFGTGRLLVRAMENFRNHRTGRNATLVAHFGFLSRVPLLLVFTAVLGFVLESYPNLQESIIDSAWNRIPFVGQQLKTEPSQLKATHWCWSLVCWLPCGRMRAFNVLQMALDDVAECRDARLAWCDPRARSLLGIAFVGGAQVDGHPHQPHRRRRGEHHQQVLLALGAVIVNAAVLAATYRWLCMRPIAASGRARGDRRWRRALRGCSTRAQPSSIKRHRQCRPRLRRLRDRDRVDHVVRPACGHCTAGRRTEPRCRRARYTDADARLADAASSPQASTT